MAYILTSYSGALQEHHPDLPSAIDRLSDVFSGELVTATAHTNDEGEPIHCVWVGEQLYGWLLHRK